MSVRNRKKIETGHLKWKKWFSVRSFAHNLALVYSPTLNDPRSISRSIHGYLLCFVVCGPRGPWVPAMWTIGGTSATSCEQICVLAAKCSGPGPEGWEYWRGVSESFDSWDVPHHPPNYKGLKTSKRKPATLSLCVICESQYLLKTSSGFINIPHKSSPPQCTASWVRGERLPGWNTQCIWPLLQFRWTSLVQISENLPVEIDANRWIDQRSTSH